MAQRRVPGWLKGVFGVAAIVGLLALGLRLRYGGKRFPNRVGEPTMEADALELVAELPMPPGNIAVSADGRIFITFHPDASPEVKVAEIVDGEARAYPSVEFQSEREGLWFEAPLSLRIDRHGHLWVLDQARHGRTSPVTPARSLRAA